jgi:hypothetical protein
MVPGGYWGAGRHSAPDSRAVMKLHRLHRDDPRNRRGETIMTAAHPVHIPSTSPCGLHELRERNCLRVIEALRFHTTLTQAGISRETGLSRTTVSTLVTELKRRGIMEATTSTSSGVRGGRPGTRLRLRPGASSADLRLVDGSSDDHINQMIQQNTALISENARLNSLVASIRELMARREEMPSRGRHHQVGL